MAYLTRADRKMIHGFLSDFESSSSIVPLEKLDELGRYFDGIGIPNQSEYRTRLARLKLTVGQKLAKKELNSKLIKIPGRYSYSGVFVNDKDIGNSVRILFNPANLIISRNYKDKSNPDFSSKLSWQFEREGKLCLIDLKEIPFRNVQSENVYHLIKSSPNGLFDYHWKPSLDKLISLFSDMTSIQSKLELLAKFGYTSAKNLFEASKFKRLKDSDNLKGEDKGLTQIVYNKFAMEILEKASYLTPRFTVVSDYQGKLEYSH